MSDVLQKSQQAKEISKFLITVSTELKNKGLQAMADALREQQQLIISANKKDLLQGEKDNIGKALLDRLALNEQRIEDMAVGLEIVINLPDPINEVMEEWDRPNGLNISKIRVPIGVIAIIYEARPNVTVDAAGLTLKTSNAVVLRGSSSAINSNKAIVSVLNKALVSAGFPLNTINLIEHTSRETVTELVTLKQYIDLVIPRGGAGLINAVVNSSTVPCIETGIGNCHVFIDSSAKIDKAIQIAINAKVQRPSVCNAAESLLIHQDVANKVLPSIIKEYFANAVEIYGCAQTRKFSDKILPATDKEYATEFSDYKISIKIVDSVDEAISHIDKFGTRHTEAIVSENKESIALFSNKVDASSIMINASTRFTDGFEFGFGAEIGISTQKMHARGPMGLKELTTYKYVVTGDGQVRE
ncbi:MAG: glutamate-5-semialdehyde dehydrogenase [Candidatus Margulisbacteria bacterium]|nr:glutamate-5-semialdehyde dehydrogenase [Candidatus Margulisiibacteriota bacterium]